MEGSKEGVNGPLTIVAEIFELTPTLCVVEVKKKGGDKTEYEEFCDHELRPALQNLLLLESAEPSQMPSDTELEIDRETQVKAFSLSFLFYIYNFCIGSCLFLFLLLCLLIGA